MFGIMAFDGGLGSEFPAEFDEVNVNVYETPFVRPVIIIGLTLVGPEAVMFPGDDVTIYDVAVEVYKSPGTNEIRAEWFAGAAEMTYGYAFGAIGKLMYTGLDLVDGADVPELFVAAMAKAKL